MPNDVDQTEHDARRDRHRSGFASGLGGSWYADRRQEYYLPSDLTAFEAAAKRRHLDKQAGLNVDRDGDGVHSPLAIPAGEVAEFLMRAAQCVEMPLTEEHTRQQDAPDYSVADAVPDLHWVILPFAHPHDFAAFVARLSGDSGDDGDGDGRD